MSTDGATNNESVTAPRIPWWISALLGLLASGVFGYFFVCSMQDPDPPWDPPLVAAIYRVGYGVLAVIFLLGAAVALRGRTRADRCK